MRVRRSGSYHGLALNVKLDLEPFARINPCGYAGSADDAAGGARRTGARSAAAAAALEPHLLRALGFRVTNL